jgi:two-component system chemotaxis response regulator CheB
MGKREDMAQDNLSKRHRLLLIGGSAGSLEVLLKLFPALRPDLPIAIVVVLHRRAGESQLAELLGSRTGWRVKEAEEKESLEKGTVYLAPGDYHLMIEKDGSLSLDYSEKVNFSRPSIDVTFETAAEAFGQQVIAVLLSGANDDGAKGLQQVKRAGGLTIVQDPLEASVSYMPQYAMNLFKVDHIASTVQMVELINRCSED